MRYAETLKVTGGSLLLTTVFTLTCQELIPGTPEVPWTEIVGTGTGVACIWFTRLENNWCWPLGIVSVILLAVTFWGYDLPGQALLNLFYFLPIQFYGWWKWTRWLPHEKVEPSFQTPAARILTAVAAMAGSLTIGAWLHSQYGGAPIMRLWDASIVASSMVGQALLNRKRVEAWWWWMLPVNVSSITLFAVQGAYMYSLMYVAFLIHSMFALHEWMTEADMIEEAKHHYSNMDERH